MNFPASRCKVERAQKHITDLNGLLARFVASDFYSISVHTDQNGKNYLGFNIDKSPPTSSFPIVDAALIIGDTLHNLRSALDLLWYSIVNGPTKWTIFPIRDTRDQLISVLDTALEKKQISADIYELVADTVQPYSTGNYFLWALDDLNVRDKHQLLIPVAKFLRFDGVNLEDDKQRPVNPRMYYLMEESSRIPIGIDMKITVKDKGHASGTILFEMGKSGDIIPFQSEPVIPSLSRIAEEVSRTLQAFEGLDASCFIVS
ncbi:MAG TPA: hypothetical protein VGS05_13020 [Candidatus Sulfotelmatobacter sp.]|nr:hypothetical protein [Candidatus Sulfotelmatobacter sp.]